jgi:alginate O-acetyltransferase complex protein AlgI
MLFNSVAFLSFFILVCFCYYIFPLRFRNFILLLSIYIFYASWEINFTLLLLFVTGISYFTAHKIEQAHKPSLAKIYLCSCFICILGLLFFFKYFNFFNENLRLVFDYYHSSYPIPYASILLPVGISFFTFEAASYLLDVYYGKRTAETSFLNYALFIAFFPKLLAGPIERSTTLLPQIETGKSLQYSNIAWGLKRVLWGLFKKAVIADRIANLVDVVYQQPENYNAPTLLFVSYLFVFQIYCDFSGYSDMAIGTARILGFRLLENFNLPFFSKSILEFWRRWHMTLSSLLRDYLYTPLLLIFARRSMGALALVLATFITFIAIGLWHGARWTFVLFGLSQACVITYEILSSKFRKMLSRKMPMWPYKILSILLTFHIVVLSFVFIKAETTAKAFTVLKRLCSWNLSNINFENYEIAVGFLPFRFSMFLLLLFLLFDKSITLIVKDEISLRFSAALYGALLACILLFGVFHHAEFIYFQF